jgi:hypothetical protein
MQGPRKPIPCHGAKGVQDAVIEVMNGKRDISTRLKTSKESCNHNYNVSCLISQFSAQLNAANSYSHTLICILSNIISIFSILVGVQSDNFQLPQVATRRHGAST